MRDDAGRSFFCWVIGAVGAILLAVGDSMAAEPTAPPPPPATMSNLWSVNIRRTSDATPAIGKDGTIYFGTFPGQLWALTPEGKTKWVFNTKEVARSNREIRSSPAVGEDGTVYFGCRDNRLYALSSEGAVKFTYETGGWVDSSPAIGEDGSVYFGSWDKHLYALTPGGEEKWKFRTGGEVTSSPVIGQDGTIYCGSQDGKFYAVKPDGTVQWEYAAGGQILSSPAIGEGGVLYFTSVNGFFHCVGPDGSGRWKVRTGGITESSPVIGSDGTIYVGVNNKIAAIAPGGEIRWERVVMGGPIQELVQASPVALEGGGLYILSQYGMLYRWDNNQVARERFYLYGSHYNGPAVGESGTVYISGSWTNFFALQASTKLADSPWPKVRGNMAGTGRRFAGAAAKASN